MTLTELVCFTTVGVVACFGIITAGLFESAIHDMRVLQKRQDMFESKLYVLEKCKYFHDYRIDNNSDEQETEEDQTIQS